MKDSSNQLVSQAPDGKWYIGERDIFVKKQSSFGTRGEALEGAIDSLNTKLRFEQGGEQTPERVQVVASLVAKIHEFKQAAGNDDQVKKLA